MIARSTPCGPRDEPETVESLRARLRECEEEIERGDRFIDQKERVLVANAIEMRSLTDELQAAKAQLEAKSEQFERAAAVLRDMDRSRLSFLASAAHELRTPITSVLAFGRLLIRQFSEAGPADAEGRRQEIVEQLSIIVAESERLALLINDMLDLARIEARKIEWRFGPIAPAEFVMPAVAAMKPLFDSWGVSVSCEIPHDLPMVRGDRDRLIQVVTNLVSHAGRFSPPGSRVDIVARAAMVTTPVLADGRGAASQRFGLIIVRDHGRGIAEVELRRIFDRFARVPDPGLDRPKGSGLGLAIAKEIVEAHGGTIVAVSEPGGGSEFTVAIPVAVEEPPREARDANGV